MGLSLSGLLGAVGGALNPLLGIAGTALGGAFGGGGGGGGGGYTGRSTPSFTPFPGTANIARGVTNAPYGGSVLGPAEILVPDAVERIIGTMPEAGTPGDCFARPQLIEAPAYTQRAKCRKGWVAVTCRETGQTMCVEKNYARRMGWWKAARKPPIKASDWRCLQRAHSTVKKVDRVVAMSNEIVGKNKYTRSRARKRAG